MMPLKAIETASRISREIDECIRDGSAAAKLKVVELRRSMPHILLEIAKEFEGVIDTIPASRRDAARTDFRKLYSELRSQLAELQSSWPVSSISGNVAEFSDAKRALDAKLNKVLEFCSRL